METEDVELVLATGIQYHWEVKELTDMLPKDYGRRRGSTLKGERKHEEGLYAWLVNRTTDEISPAFIRHFRIWSHPGAT